MRVYVLPVVLVMVLLGACGKESEKINIGQSAEAVGTTDVVMSGAASVNEHENEAAHGQKGGAAEIDMRFRQATAMLHIKQYKYAAAALRRVLELAPSMPEAYVNMGFAMLGMERFGDARGFFKQAVKLKPDQVNAYYGLALASYNTGDMTAAISALSSFIQLSHPDDPYVSEARAALTDWRKGANRKSIVQSGNVPVISQRVKKSPIGIEEAP